MARIMSNFQILCSKDLLLCSYSNASTLRYTLYCFHWSNTVVPSVCEQRMSSAHRNLGRLPLEVFTDVQFDQMTDAATLRESLCGKFKRNKNDPITTVGAFLNLPCETLVRILDPILTYGEPSRTSDSPRSL